MPNGKGWNLFNGLSRRACSEYVSSGSQPADFWGSLVCNIISEANALSYLEPAAKVQPPDTSNGSRLASKTAEATQTKEIRE